MRYAVAALLLLAALAIGAVAFRRQLFDRLAGLSPTQPSEPGDDDREASGADPEFVRELRAMREDLDEHPGFVGDEPTEAEKEDARYAAWIEECRDRLYLAEEHFAREYSRALEKFDESANATGQLYDVRELDAMLAAS